MSKGRTISPDDLPPKFRSSNGKVEHVIFPVGSSLDEVERELIGGTIEFTAGNKTLAARMLRLTVCTLYRRLERYARSGMPGAGNGLGVARRTGWRS